MRWVFSREFSHEFSVVVFLDYLCERPFDLIYQEKTIQQYQTRILGELVSVRNEVRESWIDNRVDDGIAQIISKTEEVAKENGFSQSMRRQSMKYLLPMMIGFFALSFVIIFFIGDLIPPDLFWLTYVIYTALLLVVCFLPRLINQRLMNRWLALANEKGPLVKKYITGVAERIHKFVQFPLFHHVYPDNDHNLLKYKILIQYYYLLH